MDNNNNYLPGSVSSAFVRLFLRTAQDYGVTPSDALDNCDIGRGVLDNTVQRISANEFQRLMRWLIITTDDPLFGLKSARHLMPGAFGMVGYLIMSCRTGGEALRLVPRYESLIGNLGHTELNEEGNTFAISWVSTCDDDLVRPHLVEEYMATTVEYARWVTGRPEIHPIRVYLDHKSPGDTYLTAYRDIFKCEVTFDAGANKMEFSPELMSLPMHQPDPLLLKTLQEQAERMTRDLQQSDPIVVQVRSTLLAMMETSIPRRERVASRLGMSERTLQRRLLEAESSYQQILDDLRQQLAEDWLLSQNWSVSEIAARLGFTEPRSFQRRFKTWTGFSPGEFRKQRQRQSESA